jgi:hypothetical protein
MTEIESMKSVVMRMAISPWFFLLFSAKIMRMPPRSSPVPSKMNRINVR